MARKRITRENGTRTYFYRHQIEQVLGRRLKKKEHVHHLNNDEEDDRFENLALMSKGVHSLVGRLGRYLHLITLFDHKGRPWHPTKIRFVSEETESLIINDPAALGGRL